MDDFTDPIRSKETASKQHGSWSDCAEAQAGLDPCWSQTHDVGFVVTRLICFRNDKINNSKDYGINLKTWIWLYFVLWHVYVMIVLYICCTILYYWCFSSYIIIIARRRRRQRVKINIVAAYEWIDCRIKTFIHEHALP
jgi:hypothetical protein